MDFFELGVSLGSGGRQLFYKETASNIYVHVEEGRERVSAFVMCRRRILIVFWIVSTMLNPHLSVCGWTSEEAWGEEPTPIAGEEFRTTLFGEDIYVPPRDRRSVTAISFGIQALPNGPSQMEALPFGALYLWRNWDDDNRRLRGTFSGW